MQFNSVVSQKRKHRDVTKLLVSNFKVDQENETTSTVEFNGPKDTIYEDGKWVVRVQLPEDYPYKSPSIGFVTRIYHPNIDWK